VVLSIAGLGPLLWAIIEAPASGWGSGTVVGAGLASLAVLGTLVLGRVIGLKFTLAAGLAAIARGLWQISAVSAVTTTYQDVVPGLLGWEPVSCCRRRRTASWDRSRRATPGWDQPPTPWHYRSAARSGSP
jgi:hypothetical protein